MRKLLSIAFICVFVFALSACTSTTEEQGQEVSGEASGEVQNLEESAAGSNVPGDTIYLSQWEVTLNSFEFSPELGKTYWTHTPDEGNVYLVLHVAVKNNGTESDQFMPVFSLSSDIDMKVYYDADYSYEATSLFLEDEITSSTINPLSTKTGLVVYQVPQEVVDSEKSLTVSVTKGKERLEYILR